MHFILAKHSPHRVIAADHALIVGILQVVRAHVLPDFLDGLGARERGFAGEEGGEGGGEGVGFLLTALVFGEGVGWGFVFRVEGAYVESAAAVDVFLCGCGARVDVAVVFVFDFGGGFFLGAALLFYYGFFVRAVSCRPRSAVLFCLELGGEGGVLVDEFLDFPLFLGGWFAWCGREVFVVTFAFWFGFGRWRG